jgi:hypothetical protein
VARAELSVGGLVAGLGFSAMGLWVLSTLLSGPTPAGALLVVVPAFGVGFLALGIHLVRKALGPSIAEGRFGVPEIACDPERPTMGGDLVVKVRLRPTRDVEVEQVIVDLLAYDVTMQEQDDRRVEQESEVHSDPRTVSGARLTAGKRKTFKARFAVPKVWASVEGRLRWRVRVRVEYRGGPAWENELPIRVGGLPD